MSSSEAAFREAEEAGAVSLVTSLTRDSSDVLLQLNALDLLEQVSAVLACRRRETRRRKAAPFRAVRFGSLHGWHLLW